MEYYESTSSPQLAQEFYEELRTHFLKAANHPDRYAIRSQDLRRVNLPRFPYHFFIIVLREISFVCWSFGIITGIRCWELIAGNVLKIPSNSNNTNYYFVAQ
ncbi:MAG: hypothetical protein ABJC04_01065 [Verrucomicrobiota bacterium]